MLDKEQAINRPSGQTHQFKYTTPIKDENTIKKFAKQALDSPVTLTIQEILSIAADVQKHIKEQITTKQTVSSNSAIIANLGNSDDNALFHAQIGPKSNQNLRILR